ncbi:MAG: hydrolase [Pyrinomonadaceae bacterium]|nr:hydrolase [Pyrinomonadaceae bacterium]
MQHENTLHQGQAALLIIDMQEAFRAAISDFAETAVRIALVAHAAALFDVPVLVTEQYPKGLGRTAGEIGAVLPSAVQPIEKMSFSSAGEPDFMTSLEATGKRQIIVCGIEAHICVNQTTHDLLAHGFQVHLLTDCITARQESNKAVAFAKMQASGALPSTTEMALFELLRDAGHRQFKIIQKLIK